MPRRPSLEISPQLSRVLIRNLTRLVSTGSVFLTLPLNLLFSKNILKLLEEFHKGLSFYHKQEWDKAIECFSRSNSFEEKYDGRKTNPSLVFIERSKDFKENPPVKDWDGVYALHSK